MFKYFLLVAALTHVSKTDTDGKRWVWSSARRSGGDAGGIREERLYTGVASTSGNVASLVPPNKPLFQPSSSGEEFVSAQSAKVRYEVAESNDFNRPLSLSSGPNYPEEQYRPITNTVNGRPPSFRPTGNDYRPITRPENSFGLQGNRPPINNRPINNRPILEGGNRPNGGYRPPSNGPIGGGYRPIQGPSGKPVLTGPVPSWEQDGDHYKEYDRCKCVHSFNCNTPGIQFGSCDAGKKYCCYQDDFINRPTGPNGGHYRPSGPIGGHNRPTGPSGVRDRPIGPSGVRDRPILAGPGGPVDSHQGPYRPTNDRYNYHAGQSNYDRYGNPNTYSSKFDRYDGLGTYSSKFDRYDGPGTYSSKFDRYDPSYSSGYDRYPDNNRGDGNFGITGGSFEDAYRKGLESAIHETVSNRDRYNNRRNYGDGSYYDYYGSDFNRKPPLRSKYGLYEPLDYYRSANSTIEAEKN